MVATASSIPPRPVVLSYEDLRTMPEDGRRYEILEGELCVTPAPTTSHQFISRNLVVLLQSHVGAQGLGEVLQAPTDVILDPHTVVEPDLFFVSNARLDIISERGIEGAPDLVIEVLSPATEKRDRGAKQHLYARYGVAHYWLVDGAARGVTERVLRGNTYEVRGTYHAPSSFRSALFPDLSIDLASVFARPTSAR
ncbi:MAG TPA: Uma2 family endonuclease [Polyangiales bacterium]|nr:Uma2 family endonuclease [Polyangiales bacterium]